MKGPMKEEHQVSASFGGSCVPTGQLRDIKREVYFTHVGWGICHMSVSKETTA